MSKYFWQCFVESFWLMGETNKKISIDLPTHFLSSPLSLAVSVPWLFFPTWRPSHSGFSSVCKVEKLPCLKLSGEFRSGLPYLGTLCLRIEITSACSCRKIQNIFAKITVHLKQFWQSLALNVISESPKFSLIPAGMVSASEGGDDCHSCKIRKSSYAYFKNQYLYIWKHWLWGFFNLSFWPVLQLFWHQRREGRK